VHDGYRTCVPVKPAAPTAGLGFWMERVLRECAAASRDLAVDPVHDLRVALRRCRSMADGVMAIDPEPAWKQMKRAGKQLFSSLGALRDLQVMDEWAQKLVPADDLARARLLRFLAQREESAKSDAAQALAQFDRGQWKRWTARLAARAARLKLGSVVYQHLALERWTEAYALHRKAMRSQTPHALHSLRIGIKRFRYVVENFLPQHHERWKQSLKRAQDILGEVHDLDVLWATLLESGALAAPSEHARWQPIIDREKQKRVAEYIAAASGPTSLWRTWRAALPTGKDAEAAGLQRLRLWAAFRDPAIRHSRHVTQLALDLYDGLLEAAAWKPAAPKERRLLLTAAMLHQVAVPGAKQNSHKTAYRLVRKTRPLLGWSAREWQTVSAIVRFYGGNLPARGRKAWDRLQLGEKRSVKFLAAVLRLAEAFDSDHSARIRRVLIQHAGGLIRIFADGYLSANAIAMQVSRARHVLEIACKKPIFVQPRRKPPLRRAS
jgi:CHAD domain-containing protein